MASSNSRFFVIFSQVGPRRFKTVESEPIVRHHGYPNAINNARRQSDNQNWYYRELECRL